MWVLRKALAAPVACITCGPAAPAAHANSSLLSLIMDDDLINSREVSGSL